MLNVALSSDIFEIQRFGGISRYFVELAQSLESEGLARVEIGAGVHINSLLNDSKVKNGIYLPFSPSRIGLGGVISRINSIYSREISRNSRFAIRHETFYRGGQEHLRADKSVTTVHDLIREKFTPEWKGFLTKKSSLELSDAIICVSKNTASDLVEHYKIAAEKITVIPHGVNPVFFKTSSSLEVRMLEPQLLFVGSRDGYKNFRTLVEAFSSSQFLQNNFVVSVIGSRFTKDEESLMKSLSVRNHFKYRGRRQSDLLKAYRNCLALIVTSTYEGFGMPVIEAMASECLVFSTRAGSLSEIGGGNDFEFLALDPFSLAERIESVLADKELISASTYAGRLHAEKFSWVNTASLTANLYKSLLNT